MTIRPLSNPPYPCDGGQLTFSLQEKCSCGLDVQSHGHVLQNIHPRDIGCLGPTSGFTLMGNTLTGHFKHYIKCLPVPSIPCPETEQ